MDIPTGMRNGYGTPRQQSLTTGTITGRRSRVRGLAERFVSRVLPLLKRRTREVSELSAPVVSARVGAGGLRAGIAWFARGRRASIRHVAEPAQGRLAARV